MSVLNGPGAGGWSVFAGQVAEERDALQEEVAQLHILLNNATNLAQAEADAKTMWKERCTASADAWRRMIEAALGVDPDPVNHTIDWAAETIFAIRERGNRT